MKHFKFLGLMAAAAAATGCSTGFGRTSYTRDLPFGEVLMIDASQRAIVSADGYVTRESGDNGAVNERVVPPTMCAEPSPDAITAASLAASAAANAPGQGAAQANLALSQSAASIGIRTPSIQLLRDGMYRLCEAFQNGAIQADDYQGMLQQYQQMVVGLVAIEQLTGTVRAPQVALSGGEARAAAMQSSISLQADLLRTWSEREQMLRSRIREIDQYEMNDPEKPNERVRHHRDGAIRTSLEEELRTVSRRIDQGAEALGVNIREQVSSGEATLAGGSQGRVVDGGGDSENPEMYTATTADVIAKAVREITFEIIRSADRRYNTVGKDRAAGSEGE